jgi:hypothetical protein
MKQVKDKSKIKPKKNTGEELVFTESTKEPCESCKEPKEIEVALPKYTKEELERAVILCNQFRTTSQENQWLVNLNNRVNNDNKMNSGCGKCMVQVKKNIINAYKRLYS